MKGGFERSDAVAPVKITVPPTGSECGDDACRRRRIDDQGCDQAPGCPDLPGEMVELGRGPAGGQNLKPLRGAAPANRGA